VEDPHGVALRGRTLAAAGAAAVGGRALVDVDRTAGREHDQGREGQPQVNFRLDHREYLLTCS
jgi:hypothetical protein